MKVSEKAARAISLEQRSDWIDLVQKILLPLSLLYRGGTALRSALYAYGLFVSRRLSKPVISVGNLVTGGTGKTPLVIKIVQHLSSRGVHLVVLSRGYKGSAQGSVNMVSNLETVCLDAREAGDEPYLMAKSLPGTPVLVGKDRFLLGKEAIQSFDLDGLILDDGFQHLPLRRECNLLLLDGEQPFGNGRCIPSGPLREGIPAIRRADMLLVSGNPGDETLSEIRKAAQEKPIYGVRFVPGGVRQLPSGKVEDGEYLKGKRVMAFAGIARPDRFFRSIESLGADLFCRRSFPDHYPYSQKEIGDLFEEGKTNKADLMITTEKDGVRIPEIPGSPSLYALQLAVEIQEQETFFREILQRIGVPERTS